MGTGLWPKDMSPDFESGIRASSSKLQEMTPVFFCRPVLQLKTEAVMA
jgi:hypothetical protein